MADGKRIGPKDAHTKVSSGHATLICAYDDEEKCKENRLAGAKTLAEFEASLPAQPAKDGTLIFY